MISTYIYVNSCVKRLIFKEHIVKHMHLNFVFKRALHFSILAFNNGTVALSCSCYCNTMNQSSFKCFATSMTHPLFKLKRFILLVMYNALCCYSNCQYSLTLVFFGCNWGHILSPGPRPYIISMARANNTLFKKERSFQKKMQLELSFCVSVCYCGFHL